MIIGYKKIAIDAAKRIIAENGCTTAPIDVKKIIKKLGINYVEAKQIDDDLSGFVKREGKDGKPVIVVNAEHVYERQRFTAAHELGHFLLHSMNGLFLDTAEEKVLYRRNCDNTLIDFKEVQANNFAAELLMPKELMLKDIGNEIPTDDEVIQGLALKLSKKYEVSVQSMLIRLGSFLH